MEKRTKNLLLSMLTLCICTVLVVGGTFALFSDSVTVNNHLSAGNLDVGLYRTSYKEYVLDAEGLMAESAEDTEKINLAETPDPLFSVANAVPTSWYQATIEVSNEGSTAFDYGMRILWTANDNADDNDEVFASQIRITVTSEQLDAPVTFMLDECARNDVSLGYLLKNAGSEAFTVKAEFVNDSDYNADMDDIDKYVHNNSAMLATLDFDVQVYATQKIALD